MQKPASAGGLGGGAEELTGDDNGANACGQKRICQPSDPPWGTYSYPAQTRA
jgi:hypothetical protein